MQIGGWTSALLKGELTALPCRGQKCGSNAECPPVSSLDDNINIAYSNVNYFV